MSEKIGGLTLLEFAYSLTADDLIRMIHEIEAKVPKEKMPPNPADVHPATFAALLNMCNGAKSALPFDFMDDAVTLHVRTDVDPWRLHPCTCARKKMK